MEFTFDPNLYNYIIDRPYMYVDAGQTEIDKISFFVAVVFVYSMRYEINCDNTHSLIIRDAIQKFNP